MSLRPVPPQKPLAARADAPAAAAAASPAKRRVAVVVVGEATAQQRTATLARIPEAVRPSIGSIALVGEDLAPDPREGTGGRENDDDDGGGVDIEGLPTPVRVAARGSGYGAGLKVAYREALDAGADVVVTLHGAGQYPPEVLPEMLRMLDDGADAVFGTRSVEMLASVEGGMPIYKFLGNRTLSTLENLLLRTPLSELHSGYRAVTADALASIPFERNTDSWHFDTQVIIQLHATGRRIAEVPIGVYSSEEIGVVTGVRYAAEVARSVASFKLHELGLRAAPEFEVRSAYAPKKSPLSSHARLLDLLGPYPKRVLDVGSGYGEMSSEMEQRGHTVTAIDLFEPRVPLREFIRADFSRDIPLAPERRFDVIVLADVLEHLPDPQSTLRALIAHLAADGVLLVSLPNAVHWSVRAHVAAGRFEYTNRGLLDRGHLRFFTEKSARRLFRDTGLEVARHVTTPVPWENVSRRGQGSRLLRGLELVDLALGKVRPNLFAYQHVFCLKRIGA